MAVRWSDVVAVTVSDPELPFVGRGFRLQSGRYLWSASFIHFAWQQSGYSLPVNKFMQSWGNILCRLSYLEPFVDVIFNPGASQNSVDGYICQHLLSTAAVMALVALCPGTNQVSPRIKRLAITWMKTLCARIFGGDNDDLTFRVTLYDHCRLQISSRGSIDGWNDFVRYLNPSLRELWRLQLLDSQFESVNLSDIVSFLMTSRTHPSATGDSRAKVTAAIHTLLQVVIAPGFENWVATIYSQSHDVDARARVLRNPRTRRLSGGVDPLSAWHVLQNSRLTARASERTVLATLNDTDGLDGLATSNSGSSPFQFIRDLACRGTAPGG